MNEKIAYIKEEVDNNGICLTNIQAEQFYDYYRLLIEKNKVMNLTAITNFEEVVKKHFIDSLKVSGLIDMSRMKTMIDVGCGAGFPGIPLKIAFPELSVTLLDSVGKKVHFLEDVSEQLSLKNVEAVHSRTEDLARNPCCREKYDLAVSRALAAMNVLSEYCLPYVKVGGKFAAYKSGNIEDELACAMKAIELLGGKVAQTEFFELYGMGRSIVLLDKIQKTPKGYPRKAGVPSKTPII